MEQNIEITGTWEEILQQSEALSGKQVRVVVLPEETNGRERVVVDPTAPQAKPRRTLEELTAEIWGDVPEEAWGDTPTDLSGNVDHYLYGTSLSNRSQVTHNHHFTQEGFNALIQPRR